ncbi:MAG: STAS domain-containing protein [Clostridia bacterium]|nr:STAS domain-containing protein [Clostridia bacterium]
MKAEVKEINGVKIVRMVGQVRISTQNDFKDALDEIVKDSQGRPVVLNMDGIAYMNSTGLGIIIDTYKKIKDSNGRLILCNLLPDIMNLFEVTRLNRFIEICATESEAISKAS